MNTYGIKVPFPEVMTQKDYDDLYYQKTFWENFDVERYERYCDVLDDAIEKLLTGEKEVYIEQKDIYTLFDVDYWKTKKDILKAHGIEIECVDEQINHRFILRIK